METEAILRLIQDTAAEKIIPRFRALTEGQIDEKGPGDFVTVADREAEEQLTDLLRDAYPGVVVVGEESAYAHPEMVAGLANADHAFVIDPIDGTGNFVRGREEFGVMVAELSRGVTTRGWIWQPMTGRAYCAERGGGVRLNDEPLVRAVTHRRPLGGAARGNLVGFDAGGHLSPAVRSKFSCAFDYPSLLQGDLDFIFWTHMNPWDHLAGALMVTEQGGVSRTIDGVAYSVQSRARGLLVAADLPSWMAAQQHWPTASEPSVAS